jgi:integrase
MLKQDSKGVYFLDYRDGWGKRHREKLSTVRKLAEEMAQELLHKVRLEKKGLAPMQEDSKLNFGQFWELYLSRNPSENRSSTMLRKKSMMDVHLLPMFGGRSLSSLQEVDFQRYLDKRRGEGASVGTRNKELATLKSVFTYAKRQKYLVLSPVEGIKPKSEREFRRTRVLSRDEEKRMSESANPDLGAIIKFALATGMRRSEVLGLTWDRVDMEKKSVFIPASLSKNKRHRTVPLTGRAWEVIGEKHQAKQEPAALTSRGELRTRLKSSAMRLPVFEKGSQAKWSTFRTTFQTACKHAGLRDFTFHDLRRTCATRLLEAGTDFRTVAEWIGDTPTVTAEVYCQTSPERMRQAGEKVAQMFG